MVETVMTTRIIFGARNMPRSVKNTIQPSQPPRLNVKMRSMTAILKRVMDDVFGRDVWCLSKMRYVVSAMMRSKNDAKAFGCVNVPNRRPSVPRLSVNPVPVNSWKKANDNGSIAERSSVVIIVLRACSSAVHRR